MTIAGVTIVAALALAFVNGANDVSKGVATLVGSRLTSYRRALAWGTAWTVAGVLAANVLSAGLLRTFSTSLVAPAVAQSPAFPVAVATGAALWVLVATRTAMPVSTTHALTGAIAGAALAAGGRDGVSSTLLVATVALPLALSPVLSATLGWIAHRALTRRVPVGGSYCVCLDEPKLSGLPGGRSGAAVARQMIALPAVRVDISERCAVIPQHNRLVLGDAAHWATSAALSFARGLNDAPKIMALAVLAAADVHVAGDVLFLLAALAMGLGSFWQGRRVTETLAAKVTDLDRVEGLTSSAVAALLVLAASGLAFPVSTTHVASGALIGVGASGGGLRAVRWRVVGSMAVAWLVTVPAATIFGAAMWVIADRLR